MEGMGAGGRHQRLPANAQPRPAPPRPAPQVVLTGAKRREDIYRAFESIYPVLQTFRKGGMIAAPEAPAALPAPQPAALPVVGAPAQQL